MTANPKDLVGSKKAPLSLVPPALMIAASAVMADGARKYGPYNYRETSVKASIYYEAALRHLAAWWDGEDDAEDSGLSHLAHVVGCLAILLDTKSIGRMIDDRPPKGAAADLLKRLDKSAVPDLIARFVADTKTVVDMTATPELRVDVELPCWYSCPFGTDGHYCNGNCDGAAAD